jgi:hypothetical protein
MMPRPRRWLLPALSGALLALAFPGSGEQSWLAFAALMSLLIAVDGVDRRSAGILGLLCGSIFWLVTIPWVAQAMMHYGDVPRRLAGLALLALATYLALYAAAFCWLLGRTPPYSSAVYVSVAASLWVALEPTRRRTVRSLQRTAVALENQDGRLDGRRGALASLIAGTGAVAAVLWGWRPRAADGRGYHEVARWKVPGGEGRFIAVGPAPSAEELRAVGDRLRDEFRRLENGVVMIFDEPEAAREVRRGSRIIGEERFQAALRHQRAMYVKQTARGEQSLVLYAEYPMARETVRYTIDRG